MADHTFHITIASVGETQYNGEAISATFPGESGIFTVLAHHEPFITTLKPGKILLNAAGNEKREYEVMAGVVECADNSVVVLL
jgi:F-type H+-transporting ATPase subunit epsilon